MFLEGAYRVITDGNLEIRLKCNTAVQKLLSKQQCRKRTALQNSELRSVKM